MRFLKENLHKNKNSGLTLIELIVTVALLAIISTFLVSSYTNVSEDHSMTADMAKMNRIDVALSQIILEDEVFDEISELFIEDYGSDKNWEIFNNGNLKLQFNLDMDDSTEDTSINLSTNSDVCNVNIVANDALILMSEKLPLTYQYLVDYVGKTIELESKSYKKGEYIITVDFNYTQLTDDREPTLSKDSFAVLNSGNENIHGKFGD